MSHFFDMHRPYLTQISSGQYSQAIDAGLKFLSDARQFAPNKYTTTPKGTPFYFLGIAAFLAHDYQTATFFFDAAASEDLNYDPAKLDAPALLFMQLETRNQNQAALPIVKNIVTELDAAVKNYNQRSGSKNLTVDDVRQYFLNYILAAQNRHLRSLTTTFISFLAERSYRSSLIELSAVGSHEPFFMHLFKGCLLFESLLKENPTKRPQMGMLGPILKDELSGELAIPSSIVIGGTPFDEIAQALSPNQSIETTIECTGRTRNTLGHNLVWATTSLDSNAYNLLAQNITTSCLHAISCLYR